MSLARAYGDAFENLVILRRGTWWLEPLRLNVEADEGASLGLFVGTKAGLGASQRRHGRSRTSTTAEMCLHAPPGAASSRAGTHEKFLWMPPHSSMNGNRTKAQSVQWRLLVKRGGCSLPPPPVDCTSIGAEIKRQWSQPQVPRSSVRSSGTLDAFTPPGRRRRQAFSEAWWTWWLVTFHRSQFGGENY